MTPKELLHLYSKAGIPLYDIREVLTFFGCDFDRVEIDEREIDEKKARNVLERLVSGYPISYLVGHVDLLSVRVRVDENVLIPRMETEDFLRQLLKERDLSGKHVLDLCTGSGFIALAVKKAYPDAIVTASDISRKALDLARLSAQDNALDIAFVQSDYLSQIKGRFDLILSNPPYIPLHSPNVRAPYEPELALFSGEDGMDSYRKIFPELEKHLEKDGEAYFEIESDNAERIRDLAKEKLPARRGEILLDFDGKKRFVHLF